MSAAGPSSPTVRLVLCALARYVGKGGDCWPSVRTIMRCCPRLSDHPRSLIAREPHAPGSAAALTRQPNSERPPGLRARYPQRLAKSNTLPDALYKPLSPRASAVLASLQRHADESGRVVARCRAQLAEEAGLPLGTWRRIVRGLVAAGHVAAVECARWELGLRVVTRSTVDREPGPNGPGVDRENGPGGPPISFSLSSSAAATKKEKENAAKAVHVDRSGPGAAVQMDRVSGPGVDRVGVDRGHLLVPLPADPQHAARLLAAVSAALASAHECSIGLNIRAEAPTPHAEPVAASVEAPATVRPPDGSHAAWARLREAWLNECGLPSSKCSALDNRAWLDLCSRPDAPRIEPLLAVLRREAPKWHERAGKAKNAGELDPWASVPSVRTWLQKRPWELAPDPSPRAAGERPPVPAAVLEHVEELRRKAATASNRGDHALAQDYRRQVDRALTTGAVA